MIKKEAIITLVVVFLLSSVPFTNAQSLDIIELDFTFDDGSSCYYVFTNAIRVDASLLYDGIPDNPQFNFINRTAPLADDGSGIFWYDFAWSAFFEAIDTNKDGTFTPSIDQLVGAIVPLSFIWDSWNYSDFLLEKSGQVGYQRVSSGPDLPGMEGVTGLHVNYTANMTITHGDRVLVDITDWDSVDGHTRSMDIGIKIGAHFISKTPDRFNLDYQISGWDWTYDDSILVFMLSPQVRVTEYYDSDSEPVREFSTVKHEDNRFHFGEGFLEYPQNASVGNGTQQIEVKASHTDIRDDYWLPFYAQDIPVIFTAFENFGDETLEYNFSLGIDSVEFPEMHTTPTTPTTPEISYAELLLAASTISVVTIGIILCRNSKNAPKDKARRPWHEYARLP
ncbi:MAG: hypothetical protein ACFFEF_08435 [Candidatus Thorarchaeota archaeon]